MPSLFNRCFWACGSYMPIDHHHHHYHHYYSWLCPPSSISGRWTDAYLEARLSPSKLKHKHTHTHTHIREPASHLAPKVIHSRAEALSPKLTTRDKKDQCASELLNRPFERRHFHTFPGNQVDRRPRLISTNDETAHSWTRPNTEKEREKKSLS